MSDLDGSVPAGGAIEDLPPGDGADVLAELPADELAEAAGRLDPAALARILAEMHPRSAAALLTRVRPPTASAALAAMRPDDRVDVLQHAPAELHDRAMRDMTASEAAEVRQLEQYPPESAGGIMT